jgi:hypothetical protein
MRDVRHEPPEKGSDERIHIVFEKRAVEVEQDGA